MAVLLAAEAVRKERSDRSINQPAGQDLVNRRLALTLSVAAGKSTDGREPLTVFDCQRKEVYAWPRLGCRNRRDQKRRLILADQYRAVRLLRYMAPLNYERTIENLYFTLCQIAPPLQPHYFIDLASTMCVYASSSARLITYVRQRTYPFIQWSDNQD